MTFYPMSFVRIRLSFFDVRLLKMTRILWAIGSGWVFDLTLLFWLLGRLLLRLNWAYA